jgi:hypothetical protein
MRPQVPVDYSDEDVQRRIKIARRIRSSTGAEHDCRR